MPVKSPQVLEEKEEDFRELPCRDFDMDCYAFDSVVPFGSYKKCQAYMPGMGRCLFLRDKPGSE